MTVTITHVARACHVIDFGRAVYCYDMGMEHLGRHALGPWLRYRLKKGRVDAMLRSHYHHDHGTGAGWVARLFRGRVGTYYSSGVYSSRDVEEQDWLHGVLEGQGVPVKYLERGDEIEVPGVDAKFEVVTPNPTYLDPDTNDDLDTDEQGRLITLPQDNDHRNLTVRLVYGDFSAYFSGDVGPSPGNAEDFDVDARHGINNAIADGYLPQTPVMQAPHHGDHTHLYEDVGEGESAILDAVQPDLVWIGETTRSGTDAMKADLDSRGIAWVHAAEDPIWQITAEPDGAWSLDTGPFQRPRPARASAVGAVGF